MISFCTTWILLSLNIRVLLLQHQPWQHHGHPRLGSAFQQKRNLHVGYHELLSEFALYISHGKKGGNTNIECKSIVEAQDSKVQAALFFFLGFH